MKNAGRCLALPFACLFLGGCALSPERTLEAAAGPQTQKERPSSMKRIRFAGLTWLVKESPGYVGPGPNVFSSSTNNVYVDEQGRLHLVLRRDGSRWTCAEIVTERPVGYGTYRFYTSSGVDRIDPNIVLGFFTWDDVNFDGMANCEIDIEWSRWTEPGAPNLHYSVQPAWGPDEPGGRYPERTLASRISLRGERCLDVFEWQPSGIRFSSYEGHAEEAGNRIAQWHFDADNPARRAAVEGKLTKPIRIPVPGPQTRARINVWLVDGDRDGIPAPPQDGLPCEVVIDRVEIPVADD